MKKLISLLLVTVMVLSLLAGCGAEKTPGETVTTEPTQSAEEAAVLKVLTIGNSHSVDANHMLYDVFKAENPDQEVVIYHLYKGGCKLSEHVDFMTNDKPDYTLYKNTDGVWQQVKNYTAKYALLDQAWDVVIFQEMNRIGGVADSYQDGYVDTIINYINKHVEIDPVIGWHLLWTNPFDYEWVFQPGMPDPGGESAIDSWKNYHQLHYQTNTDIMYNALVEQTNKFVMSNDAFSLLIPSGTAMIYARNVCGLTDSDLHRDYTHLSDFSRLMVAYLWYAQLMGLEEITEVNIDVIPSAMKHNPDFIDVQITQEMKQIIIDSVNYALKNPMTIPQG